MKTLYEVAVDSGMFFFKLGHLLHINPYTLYSDCAQMQLSKGACLKEIEGAISNYQCVALL